MFQVGPIYFQFACLFVPSYRSQTYLLGRRVPEWWSKAGESGTKLLYQPKPDPVVYIVPINFILGRLPLVPAWDHGTIPASMRDHRRDLFKLGKCDENGRPGSGSELFYINSWAMCWPSDHPKRPVTG